ncbi:MAG: hypothetical protein LBB15_02300, partial [Puniceicoccales bacterium]|nr:hypothetical protein [Puniceicoccales bacterium]
MSVGMGSFSQADPDRMVQMAQTLATAKGIEFPEYGNEGMQLHGNGYSASLVGLTDEDGIDFATNSIFENSQSLASFARNTLGLGDDDVSFLGSLDSGQIAFLKTEVREILMNNSPEAAAPAPTAEASQGTEAQSANTSPAAAAPAPTSEQNVQSQSASSTDNTRRTEGNSKSLLDRLKDAFMSFIDNCRFGKVFHHNKAAGAAVTKLLIEKFWGFFDEKDIPSDITFNITNAPRDSDSMLQALEMRIPHEETTETPSDATIASHREAIITGLESEVAALRAAADGHPPPPGMESTQAAADLKSLEGRISGKEPFQPS